MIDWEKADKKLSKVEEYWLSLDLTNQQGQRELVQQMTQGREKAIRKLVDKIPDEDTIRERIEHFRTGGDMEEIDELVKEVREYIELAERHPTLLNFARRMADTNSFHNLMENQVDPSVMLVQLNCYKPEVYKVLLQEAGGFEYIKILTLRTWKRVEDDIKKLDEKVNQMEQQKAQMGNQAQINQMGGMG